MPSGLQANILLVDDRAENLLALHAILEDLGHNLVEARSGHEAVAKVAEQAFAVILLDVQMPIMDGFEAAKLIRQIPQAKHTPIVFLTAYESDEFPVDQAYTLGAVDYLVKPFVPVILRAKVRGFVQLYEQTEQIHRQARQIQELERKQFEQTLAEKNARLRESDALTTAIVETALDCIVTMDHKGRVIEFNPAAETMFGLKRSDVIGKEVAELFIPPAYRQKHREGLARCLLTGEGPVLGQRLELPAQRTDGSELLVELAVTRIPHRDPPIFAAYLRDITERKRAERRRNARLLITQALAEAEDLSAAAPEILRAIGEGAGWSVGALWIQDAERKGLSCLAMWHTPTLEVARFKQLSFELVLTPGVGLPGRIWSSSAPAWIADVTQESNFPRGAVALQDGLRGAFGFPILSGREVLGIVEFFSQEVREPDPDILEMAVTLGSLIGQYMERKRAQDVLRASERRFALFMDQLPGLAWIKDERGRYIYANVAAEKAFRTPFSELRGRTDDEVFPPETAAQFKANDDQALANESGIQVVETLKDEAGEVRHSLVCKFPIPSVEGNWRYVGGMALDITDRLRAEEALREADRLKNQFLAMLAHELRNPLAPLATGLELLKLSRGNLEEETQTIQTMERQLSQMVRLIDDLLDVARITQGKMGLRRGPCELTNVLTTALDSSRPLLTKAGVELIVELPPGPVQLDGDADRLAQVFSNLLNNAAKFTPAGGQVYLSAGAAGRDVIVSVRDTGVGIPPEMLNDVFAMFTQIDRSLERSRGGLGIGLSLVRAIVELHGGVVTAESDGANRGATFRVQLPIVAEVQSQPEKAPSVGTSQHDKRCRVLVVDDNTDAAKMLSLLLSINGCEVRTAYDGLEAVEAAEAFRPHLAFVDIGLPKLNGYEAAKRIRGAPFGKEMVLTALTGWGQEEDRQRTREAGFDHHLVKPADFEMVRTILRNVCDALA